MAMRVLITGGLGFIGSNLINFLIRKKDIKKIIVIDNQCKSNLNYIKKIVKYKYFSNKTKYRKSPDKVIVVNADTRDFDFAKKITKNIDAVIHLAAESGIDLSIKQPRESFDVNVLGTFNYLECCRVNKVKSFIFSSSGAVFGKSKPPMTESTERKPISPYGSSKLSIESFCETYSSMFNINTTILRFSNAYGPFSHHKKSVISNFIKKILHNNKLLIHGDGKNTRDYIFAEDIAVAIYKSIKQKNKFNVFHVSTGNQTSILKLIKIIKDEFSKHAIKIPKTIYGKERMGDIKFNSLSPLLIKRNLNWKPSIELKNGIEKTISWFIHNT